MNVKICLMLPKVLNYWSSEMLWEFIVKCNLEMLYIAPSLLRDCVSILKSWRRPVKRHLANSLYPTVFSLTQLSSVLPDHETLFFKEQLISPTLLHKRRSKGEWFQSLLELRFIPLGFSAFFLPILTSS